MDYIRITKENIDKEHICCAMSGKQCLAKKEWLKQRFDEGLVFCRSVERGKCFIEYIPAENAWLPIAARALSAAGADFSAFLQTNAAQQALRDAGLFAAASGLRLYGPQDPLRATIEAAIEN